MAVLEYDGSNHNGFQIQKDGASTIQGKLVEVLSKVLNKKVDFKYAGRTDAGVHAKYQVINFKAGSNLDTYRFLWSVNSLLPDDIVIKKIEKVSPYFDARRSAVLREYSYFVVNKKYHSVFLKKYSIHIAKKIDLRSMKKAARMFIGVRDFGSFCSPSCLKGNTVRKIFRFTVERNREDMIIFKIAANSFLYNMVRIVIGTVLEVGSGDRELKSISEALAGRSRKLAGKILPAKGLFLTGVDYQK